MQSLIEQIASYIRWEKVDAGYKLLSEEELMEQFGVAYSTIREALYALVVFGVLESKSGKGYHVGHAYQLLPQANKSVERTTAVVAAQQATADGIQAVEEALVGVKRAIDDGEDPTEGQCSAGEASGENKMKAKCADRISMKIKNVYWEVILCRGKANHGERPPQRASNQSRKGGEG